MCVCGGGGGGGGLLESPSVCPGFLQRNLPCRSAFCYQAWHDGGTGTLFSSDVGTDVDAEALRCVCMCVCVCVVCMCVC